MKLWLQECRETHKYCSASHEPFAPGRLLDLGTTTVTRDLKLVQSRDILSERPTYVTLSHCWGSSPESSTKTTKSNLQERMSKILFESLPLTFKDAVQTTRGLGVRYLWIDSLCIIQDSLEDWEEEVAIMGQVYSQSLITLTASISGNSDEGCRVKKPPSAKSNPPLDIIKDSKRIRIFAKSPLDWNDAWNRGPLCKRGWTLQERHLATRSVHFSEAVLLWECKTFKASSELPWMQMKIEDPPPLLMLNSAVENTVKFGSLAMREHWFNIVEDYSQRNLTCGTDKLPALDGLAQISTQLHGAYFKGLFWMDMPSALLWRRAKYTSMNGIRDIQPGRPNYPRAPTWSWAAVDGMISYDSQRLNGQVKRSESSFAEHGFGFFTILKPAGEAVSHETGDTFCGAGSGGSIRVAGRLTVSIADLQASSKHMDTFKELEILIDRESERIGAIYPDDPSDLRDGQDLFCLEVRQERYLSEIVMPYGIYHRHPQPEDEDDSRAMVMGLALVRDDEHAGDYRRVGLVRWMKRSCFANVQPCQVTIR